ncbi:MAG: hypothetical protein ACHQEB_02545 [Chitinophagales bacterium]
MKRSDHPALYFSAYPLKAINQLPSADQQSPYLKAILTGKTRTLSRVRVSPMVNPYKAVSKPAPVENEKLPKDIELSEKDWFKNYE